MLTSPTWNEDETLFTTDESETKLQIDNATGEKEDPTPAY